jgi:hypothetical protein
MLESIGCSVAERAAWAALPSVTGTAKPAVAPIGGTKALAEEPEPYNFEPLTSYQFRKAVEDNGWKVVGAKGPIPAPLKSDSEYSAINRIWCEFGDIDHEGHERGWRLTKHLNGILEEIRDRIAALLAHGWRSVRVVTDHGWLLLPGGLPKIDLPSALTENKWGRCAFLKPGASTSETLFPWFWNPHEHFALADGVSCYRKGEEYAHGGLSLQECLTLELTVTKGGGCSGVKFNEITWKGMRCTVSVSGSFLGLSIDIRTEAGNPQSSVAAGKKTRALKEDGTVSIVVEDDDLEGRETFLVVFDSNGAPLAQATTIVGGGDR